MSLRILLILSCLCVAVAAQGSQSPCPTISIEMPKGMLAPKAPGIFTAKLSGSGYGGKLWYSWAATRGTVSGEFGSPVMQLLTTKKDGGVNVTVFVRVEGLTPGCPNMASEIVSVAQIPEVDPPDGFGVLKTKVKAPKGKFLRRPRKQTIPRPNPQVFRPDRRERQPAGSFVSNPSEGSSLQEGQKKQLIILLKRILIFPHQKPPR